MLGWIVKPKRLIEMRSPLRDVPGVRQCRAHLAVADQERNGSALFLRERQELCRKLTDYIAVKGGPACDPEAIKDRKQQKRVFLTVAKRLGLFNKLTGLVERGSCFQRRMTLRGIKALASPTWSFICSRRSAGVAGKVAISASARLNCATASTDRSSERCPALSHHSIAASVRPAWLK